MNKLTFITLGLLGPSLIVAGAAFGQTGQPAAEDTFGQRTSSQGLIGEPYFGLDGGWERLDNDESDDGWGVGAELNAPLPMAGQPQFGTDLNLRFDYSDVLDRDIWDVRGLFRGYMREEMFKPFAGIGVGWLDADVEDTIYLPLEVGLEFGLGPVSLAPFFRYSFAFDSGIGDFWEVGGNGVYWLAGDGVGLTASVTYTDYDDFGGAEGISDGIGARVGLVFSY